MITKLSKNVGLAKKEVIDNMAKYVDTQRKKSIIGKINTEHKKSD
jgi:hypothetical protein